MPVSGEIVLNFAGNDIRWHTNGDDGVATQLYYGQSFENTDLRLFQIISEKATCILDVGAFSGLYSVVGALKNSNARIFTFEPSSIAVKRIEQNLRLNRITNVTLIESAVGAQNGKINFYIPKNDSISTVSSVNEKFTVRKSNEGVKESKRTKVLQKSVPITTLDSFAEKHELSNIELIKIDVETHEMAVFEGARKILEKYNPVIIVEIFLNEERKKFFNSFTRELGYYPYLITNDGIVRLDNGLIPNYGGCNYLFSKKKTKYVYSTLSNKDWNVINELTDIGDSDQLQVIGR